VKLVTYLVSLHAVDGRLDVTLNSISFTYTHINKCASLLMAQLIFKPEVIRSGRIGASNLSGTSTCFSMHSYRYCARSCAQQNMKDLVE